MNQTPKLTLPLHVTTFLSVLLVITFSTLNETGANGIYTYTFIGAMYEMLWLPLLLVLVGIPLVWLVLAIKKKVAWNKLILPFVLTAATFLYLIYQ